MFGFGKCQMMPIQIDKDIMQKRLTKIPKSRKIEFEAMKKHRMQDYRIDQIPHNFFFDTLTSKYVTGLNTR